MKLRLLVISVVATCAVLGCSSASNETADRASTTRTTAPAADRSAAGGKATNVAALDLTVDLPDSFHVSDNPDFALLAKSVSPRAVMTMAPETSSVVNHEAERGETLEQGVLQGRQAVIVTGANVAGLPAGIVANELLVDNGADSFSLILSTDPTTLAALWRPLIHSIRFRN